MGTEIEELRHDIQENTKEIRLNTDKSIELIAEQKATRIVDNRNRIFLQNLCNKVVEDNNLNAKKILDWGLKIAMAIILVYLGVKVSAGWLGF